MADEYVPLNGPAFVWKDADGLIVTAAKLLGRGIKSGKAYFHVGNWDTWFGSRYLYLSAAGFHDWRDAIAADKAEVLD